MTAPVGIATQAGLSGALGTFALAVVALFTDHTPAAYSALAVAAAALLTVLAGRYTQANNTIKASPVDAGAAGRVPPDVGDRGDGLSEDEPSVWGTPPDPSDPSLNADPTDVAGATDHPVIA
jgi:hypothetical protein